MHTLVLMRHGITSWADKFTGWADIDILPEGLEAAYFYGQKLNNAGFSFDYAYTSYLKRAIKTTHAALDATNLLWIPTIADWRLNERHYGALQGLNKRESSERWGEQQVQLWRRDFSTQPPQMTVENAMHPSYEKRYATVPEITAPWGESLADTIERVKVLWHDNISKDIKNNKKILISASGNSLRALLYVIDSYTPQTITTVTIPYCIPLICELNADLQVTRKYYLETDAIVSEAIEKIKNQAK